MARLTPVWTRAHARLSIAAGAAVLGAAISAWGDPLWTRLLVACLFAALVAAAISMDPFITLLLGLGAAALAIAVRKWTGAWAEDVFVLALAETLLFTAVAALGGWARGALVSLSSVPTPVRQQGLSAFAGSVGILPPDKGELRLEEEVDRASLHQRPLSLLRIGIDFKEAPERDEHAQKLAYRAMGRAIEGNVRPTDIPFVHEHRHVVVILLETPLSVSWEIAVRLAGAVAEAGVRVGEGRGRRRLSDIADIRLAVVGYPENGRTADMLLEASAEGIADVDDGTTS